LQTGEDYYRANVPVIDHQLAKAGVRLAKFLNDALGKKWARGVDVDTPTFG